MVTFRGRGSMVMERQDRTTEHPARRLLAVVGRKRRVLIMCHNNPDPDTIAAALALKTLLYQAIRTRAVIAYGGRVGRAENRELVRRLKIEMTPVRDLEFDAYSMVCLVDTQPRTGNNSLPREILPQVVIDHHPPRQDSLKCPLHDIRPHYGSSSTILTEYFRELALPVEAKLATALFYGLKTDTQALLRSGNKADLEAFTYLFPRIAPRTLAAIENPSVPKSYYLKYAEGIGHSVQYQDVIISNLGRLNNPDIASEMADFLLRMEGVRWTLCLGEYRDELILSVRTSRRGWWAGKVTVRVLRGLGTGGGHERSAGGRVDLKGLSPEERRQRIALVCRRFLKVLGANGQEGRPLVPAVAGA